MKYILLLITIGLGSVLVSCEAERGSEPVSRQTVSPEPAPKETTVHPGFGRHSEVRVSHAESNSAEPQVAAAGEFIFVVYAEHERGRAADIYLQKYSINAEPASERVRVNPEKNQARTWYGDPPTIAVGDDGEVYVAWTAGSEGRKGTDIMLSVSRDGGETFETPVKVNDDTEPVSHGMHSLAVGRKGEVYVAWLDERNVKPDVDPAEPSGNRAHTEEHIEPNAEVYLSVSTDRGTSFLPNKKIASDVCPCCRTSMAAAGDGRLYVSWRQVLEGDLRHIAVASSSDSGQTFSGPVIVSDDKWQIRSCPMSGAALAATPQGVQVLWYTAGGAGQPGLYISASADNGATFSERELVSADSIGGTPALLRPTGDPVFAFASEDGTEIRRGKANTRIDNALLPAAAISGNSLFTVFVRDGVDRKEVWLGMTELP